MSIRNKVDVLFNAACSPETTPEEMSSLIRKMKSDSELISTGSVLPAFQGALHLALASDNTKNPERRFEVIKIIADAEAKYYAGKYLDTLLIQAVIHNNPEYIIRKIIALGIDLNAVDCTGHDAKFYAESYTKNERVKEIIDEAMKAERR